jgi:hypothetical protein
LTCAAAAILLIILAGCAPLAAENRATDAVQPRVFFAAPQNGADVGSPLLVKMQAENFIIEPAGEVRAGAGHLHILVDTDCIAPGQGIPNDDNHLHYGKAQTEAEIALTPGEHTLCLQAADGNHVALAGAGMTQTIAVTVE